MAAPLPLPLRGNQAVEGAFVVISGRQRVAYFPQRQRRAKYLPSEAEKLRMRPTRAAREICERNLDDAESAGVGFDQDFFLHLEVRGLELEVRQGVAPVQAISAGHVAYRHR